MNRKRNHSAVFDFLLAQAWALREPVMDSLVGLVMRHVNGSKLGADEVRAIVAERDERHQVSTDPRRVGATAVVPITGVLAKYASQVNGSSQPEGTSMEQIGDHLRAALADDEVENILLHIDSPGGSVDGIAAMGDTIAAAEKVKPVVAYVDGQACSAAYWLASQAGRIVAGRDAAVGSIGVYAAVRDASRAFKNEGVDVHVVKAGRFKGVGVRGAPIEAGDLTAIQKEIDSYYQLFVETVAQGRGLSSEDVTALATGEVWIGKQALDLGLIDSIGSFEATLGGLNGQGAKAPAVAAGHGAAVGAAASAERTPKEGDEMTKATTEGAAAPATAPQPLTIERLRAEAPQLLEQIEKQGFAAGVAAERERITELAEACPDMSRPLLLDLVKKDVSVKDGLKAILANGQRMKADRLEEIKAAAAEQPKVGAGGDAPAGKAPQTDEEKWKSEYAADKGLQAEFGGEKHYIRWQKRQAASGGGR